MRTTRSKATMALMTLTLFSLTRMKIPHIESVYRLLSSCSPSSKSYIHLGDLENLPPIIARREKPSHIILCEQLLTRRNIAISNGLEAITTKYGLTEDESVCTDWAAPHASLLEMFASTVVGHVAAKYQVTYQHNCGAEKLKKKSVVDGNDWTTIQQIFPVSSLVLDDNSISEDEILGLCYGCIEEFKQLETKQNTNVNPLWYDPEETHHCILDPRKSLPLNFDDEVDLEVNAKMRSGASFSVMAKSIDSVQDRVLLAIKSNKVDERGDDLDLRPLFVSHAYDRNDTGESTESLPNSDHDSDHDENDVVIYIERESMTMNLAAYSKHIDNLSVTSIFIHLQTLCAKDIPCYKHGIELHTYLSNRYTFVTVTIDVISSTAEVFSCLVLARYLICPPGTTGCLIPAMSKASETYAFIGESTARSNTLNYFDIMPNYGDQLTIATVDALTRNRLSPDDDNEENYSNTQRSVPLQDTPLDSPLSMEDAFSNTGFRDGCLETTAKNGSWESDFSYDSLKNNDAKNLRGSSLDGVMVSERFGGGTPLFHDISQKGAGGGGDTDDAMDERMRAIGKVPVWREDNPECEMEFLTLEGLCEVVTMMQLTVIHFVGDKYTKDMLRSFWNLLNLPEGDNPGNSDSKSQEDRERTVKCEKENRKFDIVFTSNKKLVTDLEGDEQKNEEKPVVAPYVPPVQTDYGAYESTAVTNTASHWNDPYSVVPQITPNFYSGAGMPGGPQPQPPYSNSCGCVPFIDQYQANVVYSEPAPPPPQPVIEQGYIPKPRAKQFISVPLQHQPQQQYFQQQQRYFQPQPQQQYFQPQPQPQDFVKQNRQIVMAGQGDTNYADWCKQFDAFGQRVNQAVNPQDIVMMRSAVPPHGSCGCQTCGRRTEEKDTMTEEEIIMANDYMARSIAKYRRRTGQTDLLTYNPMQSQKPQIHMLDVSHMTRSHPHAKASSAENDHGRKLCQAQGLTTAPMVDSWNHLFYNNMKDMAMAQSYAVPQVRTMAAPPGTPYAYAHPPYKNYFP